MGKSKPSSAKAPKAPAKRRQSPTELAPQVLAMLPGKQAHVARALGRKPSDGTVRKALDQLQESGAAEKVDGVWRRCEELPAPAIPDTFDQEAVALFTRTHAALVEQGTWRDHDHDLLVRYARRDQDARSFRRARSQFGDFQQATTRVYANPAIDKERDALRDVQLLADALVLTPDARRRHGRDGDEDDGEGGDEFDL
jgi:phage terminase small subunit